MDNLSDRTKQGLKKYRYALKNLNSGKIEDDFYSMKNAQKMQNIRYKESGVVYQVITIKKGIA